MSLDIRSEEGHPSRHTLAQYHAGEIAGNQREWLVRHLSECETCGALLTQLESEKQAFQIAHPREVFLAEIRARTEKTPQLAGWVTRLLASINRYAIPLAAASILLLVIGVWLGQREKLPSKQNQIAEQDVRLKGSELELSLLVQENGKIKPAEPNRIFHPGDRIQFRLSAPAGFYLYLIGIDETSQVSAYYPPPGTSEKQFDGGANRPVEGSVLLDSTLGKERVFAILCQQPIVLHEVTKKLREYPDGVLQLISLERLPMVLNCRQTSLLLNKG
jgi:hypothetical protein